MIKLYKVLDKDRKILGYAASESRNKAKGYIAKYTKSNYKDLLVNRVYENSSEFIDNMVNEGDIAIKQSSGEFYRTNIKKGGNDAW